MISWNTHFLSMHNLSLHRGTYGPCPLNFLNWPSAESFQSGIRVGDLSFQCKTHFTFPPFPFFFPGNKPKTMQTSKLKRWPMLWRYRKNWLQNEKTIIRAFAFSASCLTAAKVARSAGLPVRHDSLRRLIYQTATKQMRSPVPFQLPSEWPSCLEKRAHIWNP